LSDCGIF
jgi:hypothetical protein